MTRESVSDLYAAPASVILNPSSTYASGGTDLGRLLDITIAQWSGDFDLLDKMPTGSLWTDARFMGTNMVLRCTFAQRSDNVMSTIFGALLSSSGNVEGRGTQLIGHRVTKDDMLNAILIRPDDSAQDHLFFPKALVTEIGPALFGRRTRHLSAMTITFAALYDDTSGTVDSFFQAVLLLPHGHDAPPGMGSQSSDPFRPETHSRYSRRNAEPPVSLTPCS
ncbi:MAG: hypothetical protein IIA33_03905, partial [Planctomycetes bacterium]|nr:hypothetical protein [Planctomycetota bacterium]